MATKDRKIHSPQELRAALQRLVEATPAPVSFTEGAAQVLASRAAETITRDARRPGYDAAFERARASLHDVISSLEAHPDVRRPRIDKREIVRLRRLEAFCGIAPWC